MRLLFVAVALLLRNLWVWLQWCALAEPRRGGRRPRLERLRLRVMANWLLHLAERLLGGADHTHADHPPDKPLMPRRPRIR